MGLGKAFKKATKAVGKAAKQTGQAVSKAAIDTHKFGVDRGKRALSGDPVGAVFGNNPLSRKLSKAGIIDPLGLNKGGATFKQRVRKVGRIGAGVAGGFVKGGIPGAIAGGAVAGIQAGRKYQGDVPLTLGRGLKDFGGGYLAGTGTNLVGNLLAKGAAAGAAGAAGSAASSSAASSVPTAGINGVVSAAPAVAAPAATTAGTVAATTPTLEKVLAANAAKELASGAVNPQPYEPPPPMINPQQMQLDQQQYIQNILDSYNKRKERYFHA